MEQHISSRPSSADMADHITSEPGTLFEFSQDINGARIILASVVLTERLEFKVRKTGAKTDGGRTLCVVYYPDEARGAFPDVRLREMTDVDMLRCPQDI